MDWSFLIKNKDSITVTTDSRKVTPGSVFVALKGEHFDGNDFVEQAKKNGAAYIISGENALAELQDLARAWRREFRIPVIAITGTNGKTTTKELTAAVLSKKYNVCYTQGNLNNQLGVPLTLLSITRAHEIAIIEMGASHPGDIKELVEIAEPTDALITNVGKAHLQGFGSFEGVQQTKGELYDWIIAHGGTIFYNAENPYLCKMLKKRLPKGRKTIRKKFNKIHWYNEVFSPGSDKGIGLFRYRSSDCPVKVSETHLVGDYNQENIAAAFAIGMCMVCTFPESREAICEYVPTNNRSQLMPTEKNTVVVDAYNANPTSMQAAIEAFCLTAKRSNSEAVQQRSGLGQTCEGDHEAPGCFILGAMRELGEYSHLEHQNIVNMLLERKADKVLLVGEEYKQTTAPYPVFDNVEALCDYLQREPLAGYRILLKGSRSNQLEKVIPLL